MDYVKICYRKIRPFPIITKSVRFVLGLWDVQNSKTLSKNFDIRHTFLEISYNNKIERIGFYNKDGKENLFWFFISVIIPVRGKVEREMKKADKCVLLTRDKQEVRRIIESISLTKWKTYHALFRNCFHWRNEVLRRAGVRF